MPTSSRAGVVHIRARLNGEMLCKESITPFHSTYRGGSVGLRDDVGIVPYKRDGAGYQAATVCFISWRSRTPSAKPFLTRDSGRYSSYLSKRGSSLG